MATDAGPAGGGGVVEGGGFVRVGAGTAVVAVGRTGAAVVVVDVAAGCVAGVT